MRTYVNKCATCLSFRKSKGKRAGICINPSSRCYHANYGLVNMAKMKCLCYSFNTESLCKCGTFKETSYNYCPKCGSKLKEGEGSEC